MTVDNNIAKEKKGGLIASKIFAVPEVGILIPLIVILVLFYLINNAFLSPANFFSVLKTLAFFGIVAVGETLLIIGGDIDISVGSVAGFGAVFSTYVMMKTNCFGMLTTSNEWIGVILSIIICLAVCSIFGFVNAFFIVDVKMPPFIVTIATMWAIRGAIMVVTQGNPIEHLPEFFNKVLGTAQIPIVKVGDEVLGISLVFIIFIILIIVFDILLRKTTFGRNIYATGSNREVARLSGINTRRVRYTNFIILSVLAGLSGIFVAAQVHMGYPPIGLNWEMYIIAMCAVGGASLSGGSGTLIGTLIGVLILNFVDNGLVMTGINTFLQQTVQGIIIIAAVYIDTVRRNRKVLS